MLSVSATSLAAAEPPTLNIYNWADYIAPDTIGNFEREFGIDVNYDLYDSTEIVEAKMLSGSTGYDVVFHAYRYSARLIKVGVYQPLDLEQLPLRGNLDPFVLEATDAYDPGNLYGVPYMWGSTGFSYNARLVHELLPDAPLHSAAMLFDPQVVAKLAGCGVSLLDEPTDVIPMVLLYLGHDPNSLEPDVLAAAEEQLKSVRPYIRYFSSTRMINDLPNEEICVAMSWAGDYAQAVARAHEVGSDVDLAYTMPGEGSMVWIDGMFIPADARHPGNAHLFINYLMRPQVIAEITNFIHYSNANRASLPFVDPAVANDPAVYPQEADRERMHHGHLYGPKKERLRSRSWSRIKTGL